MTTAFGTKVTETSPIESLIPAAFSQNYSPNRSDKYVFVSTQKVIEEMEKLGWKPAYAKQTGSGPYGRHAIRFSCDNGDIMPKRVGDVFPQIIFDNSHNGTSRASFHIGLFKLACTNGLVVAVENSEKLSVKHIGITSDLIYSIVKELTEKYSEISKRIVKFQKISLNDEQKKDFAIKAIAAREPMVFIDKETGEIKLDKVHKIYDINEILESRRPEDAGDSLWNILNVTQERLVNGLMQRQTMKGRKSKARVISNVARNIEFNKNLWSIAEEFVS